MFDYLLINKYPAGNRESVVNGGTVSYVRNSLNQYTSVGGVTHTWTANGNLLNDGSRTFGYDYENRLTSVSGGISYAYDAQERRVEKNVSGAITKYIYDGSQIIQERNAAGSVIREYIYGAGIDEPMMLRTPSSSYYYQFDALGSVAHVNGSSGAIVESYKYDVYGQFSRSGTDIENQYFFTGRQYDPETGLYYYRARYYSPSLGRFLQTDPLHYVDGPNLYTYVTNNPVNLIDPLGFWTVQIGGTGSGGLAGGGSASAGFVFGYSKAHGFQIGAYQTLAGGGYAGGGGSLTMDFTWSPNPNVQQLCGMGASVGASGGAGLTGGGEINVIPDAYSSYTIGAGVGIGTIIEQHGFISYTWVQSYSFGGDQSAAQNPLSGTQGGW